MLLLTEMVTLAAESFTFQTSDLSAKSKTLFPTKKAKAPCHLNESQNLLMPLSSLVLGIKHHPEDSEVRQLSSCAEGKQELMSFRVQECFITCSFILATFPEPPLVFQSEELFPGFLLMLQPGLWLWYNFQSKSYELMTN